MKNDYPELNFDMEHLLQTKKYEELSPEELTEISDFISSKEDYVLMQNTFLSVKTSFGTEEEIIPTEDTKSKLMQAFESKHGKVVNINKPRPFYLSPLFQVGVAAVFILGIVFFYPNGKNDDTVTAMNNGEDRKEENAAPTEKTEDAGAGESVNEETVAEKELLLEADRNLSDEATAGNDRRDAKPFGAAVEKLKSDEAVSGSSTVTSKNLPSKDLNVVTNRSELAKEEKSSDVLVEDSEAETTAGFALATPAVVSVDDLDIVKTESKKSSKKDKAEKAKEKKEGDVRTNSIGGRYYQPASAMDVKVGVSLKDQPDLTTFLFTAL